MVFSDFGSAERNYLHDSHDFTVFSTTQHRYPTFNNYGVQLNLYDFQQ